MRKKKNTARRKAIGGCQYQIIQLSSGLFFAGTVLLVPVIMNVLYIWLGYGWMWDDIADCYMCISRHFSSGTVDKLLVAFGIINVFCSYMISARDKIVHGIKLLTVMQEFFRYHGWCFIMYTFAVILGIYINNLALHPPMAVYSLFIVAVYLLSVMMFSCVFSFGNGWDRRITEYYVKYYLFAKIRYEEIMTGELESRIRSAAGYIRERFKDERKIPVRVMQNAVDCFGSMPFEIEIKQCRFSYIFLRRGNGKIGDTEKAIKAVLMARIFAETMFDDVEKSVRREMVRKCLKAMSGLYSGGETYAAQDNGRLILLCGILTAIMKLHYDGRRNPEDFYTWLNNITADVAAIVNHPENDGFSESARKLIYLYMASTITAMASMREDDSALNVEFWKDVKIYFKKIPLENIPSYFGYGQIVNYATEIIRPAPEYGWIKSFQTCRMVSLLHNGA